MLRLIRDLPPARVCEQPGPCRNHAMWIVGHIACTDDFFLREFGGRSLALPEAWHTLFGGGSVPTDDPARYPSFPDVRHAFREQREALTTWLEEMSETQLDRAVAEKWQPYAPTMRDVGHFAAWHEGYHAGQLSNLRRAFGLDPAFG